MWNASIPIVSNDRDKKKMEIKAATRRSLLSRSECVPSELVDFSSSEETHSLLDNNDCRIYKLKENTFTSR